MKTQLTSLLPHRLADTISLGVGTACEPCELPSASTLKRAAHRTVCVALLLVAFDSTLWAGSVKESIGVATVGPEACTPFGTGAACGAGRISKDTNAVAVVANANADSTGMAHRDNTVMGHDSQRPTISLNKLAAGVQGVDAGAGASDGSSTNGLPFELQVSRNWSMGAEMTVSNDNGPYFTVRLQAAFKW